ncbi:hypothetical protein [Nocardioides ferulae]|uniref:hypothetical protein n=1 Tax=Nocardioides ferulae TaxID=2340821 RepID=UPI000EAB8BCA|nr:hypothetical protein [Nocardioides ferulae]
MDTGEKRPVLTGLVALVAVAMAVGLVLGGAALAATRVLGLGDGDETGRTTSEQSLYLPKPTDTGSATGPLITLPAQPGDSSSGSSAPDEPTETKSPKKQISLSAGQTSVSPMGRIDLTGVYPQGEGAVVQVQIFEGGWTDFAGVDAVVTNETFSTWIQTGRAGEQRFRVIDTETGQTSNQVKVTIG